MTTKLNNYILKPRLKMLQHIDWTIIYKFISSKRPVSVRLEISKNIVVYSHSRRYFMSILASTIQKQMGKIIEWELYDHKIINDVFPSWDRVANHGKSVKRIFMNEAQNALRSLNGPETRVCETYYADKYIGGTPDRFLVRKLGWKKNSRRSATM